MSGIRWLFAVAARLGEVAREGCGWVFAAEVWRAACCEVCWVGARFCAVWVAERRAAGGAHGTRTECVNRAWASQDACDGGRSWSGADGYAAVVGSRCRDVAWGDLGVAWAASLRERLWRDSCAGMCHGSFRRGVAGFGLRRAWNECVAEGCLVRLRSRGAPRYAARSRGSARRMSSGADGAPCTDGPSVRGQSFGG